MQGPVQETSSSCGKSLGDFQIGYDLPTDCKGVIGRVLPQQTGLRQVKLWIIGVPDADGQWKTRKSATRIPGVSGIAVFPN